MILQKSSIHDIEELTRISTEAFASDILVGGTENDGPPGYDSKEWHMEMLKENHLYTYFTNEHVIIGGAILFGTTKLYVGRIFIDPRCFHKGYGISFMNDIEKLFHPQVVKLDTPLWNTRTNSFYKKCGYKEIGRDLENVYYEKRRTS